MTAEDQINLLLDRIDSLEAELAASREIGPCGKHPKMFWVEKQGADDSFNRVSALIQKAVPYATIIPPRSGHCTLCAEQAEIRQAAEEAALKEAVRQVWTGWEVPIQQLESSWMAGAISAKIQNLIHAGSALDRLIAKAVIAEAEEWNRVHGLEPLTDPVTWRIHRLSKLRAALGTGGSTINSKEKEKTK